MPYKPDPDGDKIAAPSLIRPPENYDNDSLIRPPENYNDDDDSEGQDRKPPAMPSFIETPNDEINEDDFDEVTLNTGLASAGVARGGLEPPPVQQQQRRQPEDLIPQGTPMETVPQASINNSSQAVKDDGEKSSLTVKNSRMIMIAAALCCLVVIVAVVGGVCGSGACSPSDDGDGGVVRAGNFCHDLTDLEKFMTDALAYLNEPIDSKYECNCYLVGEEESPDLQVTCSITLSSISKPVTITETARFATANDGIAHLEVTEWCRQFQNEDDNTNYCEKTVFCPQQEFLCSCEGSPGCESCEVCGDGLTIDLDCSGRDTNSYHMTCDEAHVGSFLNVFNFPKLLLE